MKAGFEASHPGVTVHVLNPGGTEAMFKKLESESGNPQADVVHAGSMINYQHAITLGLLEPYAPQASSNSLYCPLLYLAAENSCISRTSQASK